MPMDPDSILVYVKNHIGIAMPIFVHRNDRVDTIWDEVATSRRLNQGVIKGKALVHNGKRLLVTDLIRDTEIKAYDYIYLEKVAPLDLHQLSIPLADEQRDGMHRSPSGFNECP